MFWRKYRGYNLSKLEETIKFVELSDFVSRDKRSIIFKDKPERIKDIKEKNKKLLWHKQYTDRQKF